MKSVKIEEMELFVGESQVKQLIDNVVCLLQNQIKLSFLTPKLSAFLTKLESATLYSILSVEEDVCLLLKEKYSLDPIKVDLNQCLDHPESKIIINSQNVSYFCPVMTY